MEEFCILHVFIVCFQIKDHHKKPVDIHTLKMFVDLCMLLDSRESRENRNINR